MNALPTDARTMFRKEEFVSNMGQRPNYAAKKDAQIKLRKEVCVSSMGHSRNDAAV